MVMASKSTTCTLNPTLYEDIWPASPSLSLIHSILLPGPHHRKLLALPLITFCLLLFFSLHCLHPNRQGRLLPTMSLFLLVLLPLHCHPMLALGGLYV